MIADYEVSAQLNKMFINHGVNKMSQNKIPEQDCEKGSKMSETKKEINQTVSDELFEELRTSRFHIIECHRQLKSFLADRDKLLKEGKYVLDKLYNFVCENVDGYNDVILEYIQLQDSYQDLYETKEKYQK